MSRSRAYTRHQKFRAQARAKRFVDIMRGDIIKYTEEDTIRQIHLYEKNRKPCSCGICRSEKYRDARQKCGINTLLNEW
jgi:hypothetical protein